MTMQVPASMLAADVATQAELDAAIAASVQIVNNVATLRNITPTLSRRIQTCGYYIDGDGGAGQYFPKVGAAAGTYVHNGFTVIVPNGGDGSAAWLLDVTSALLSVKQAGAKGDGVTDDTVAIAACIAAVSNIGVAGGGSKIIFPKGTYLCHISLIGTLNNSMGEYGICLSGYGATLKGRASDTSIIQVNLAVAGTADPNHGGSLYCNGTTIEGFTLDMSLMANAASSYAIAVHHMYNSSLRDIHVIGEPALGGGLFIGSQCYTWDIGNLNCARVNIKGYDGTNLTTSLVFHDLVAQQVVLENVFAVSLFGGVIQGSQDHFNCVNNVQTLVVMGMDLEGTGGVCYRFGTNCRNITSIGNHPTGYTAATYSTGLAVASNLSDRPVINSVSGGSLGTYAKIGSQGVVTVTNPTVAPIYYFYDVPASNPCALVMICGDNGSNGFQDLIMVFSTFVTVVNLATTYGSPPTRTYTCGSNILNIAVSAGTYNIRTVVSEFLHN
jgi:hypothetical protein